MSHDMTCDHTSVIVEYGRNFEKDNVIAMYLIYINLKNNL